MGFRPGSKAEVRVSGFSVALLNRGILLLFGAPCRRSSCGKFCEKAERGNTMSQPTSCAFCFRSPCTCDKNPMIDVPFFSLLFSLGIRVNGFTLLLFRSKIISDGFSSPFCCIFSIKSLSVLTNSTFTLSLRAVS